MRQFQNVLLVQHPEAVPTEWPPNVDVIVEVVPDKSLRTGDDVVALMVWHGAGKEDCHLVRTEALAVQPIDTLADRVHDAVEEAVITESNPTVRAIRDGVRRVRL